MNWVKSFCLLFFVKGFYVIALYFYCRGFLLSRHALLNKSSCREIQCPYGNETRLPNWSEGCWIQPRFTRAIFLVIDALKFDFVDWKLDTERANAFYHNRLKSMETLRRREPGRSLLFRFVADPPTTTLQRLKAMTTGSLPTFVDAGSNFGGEALDEDNLVDQLRAANRSVHFLGDDTWTSLFPGRFRRSFPFPSFDVKDLHTVDDGIISQLDTELRRDDWTLLIAHFLGVDHCGHKYGPNHPEMTKKLDQMDDVIRNVTEVMGEDTILFVLGDHGMTETGDHGGDSDDEVQAALFIYSPTPLRHDLSKPVVESVSQVDLVPTVALLLDFPIPFSSLGAVIDAVFPDEETLNQAARANVWQVVRFTETYLSHIGDEVLTQKLSPILKVFYSLHPDELTPQRCLEVIGRVRKIFQDSWARFHTGWMTNGFLAILENFLWSLRLLVRGEAAVGVLGLLLKLPIMLLMLLAVFAEWEIIPFLLGIFLTFQVLLDLQGLASDLLWWRGSCRRVLPLLLLLNFLHSLSFFSNSFVVYEDAVLRFLLQSGVVVMFLANSCAVSPRNTKTLDWSLRSLRKSVQSRFGWKNVCWCVLMLGVIRGGVAFARCREEQLGCISSPAALPFASLATGKETRFFLAVVSQLTLAAISYWFLSRNGHLDGSDFKTMVVRYGLVGSTLATLAHWLCLWLPESMLKRYPLLQFVSADAHYVVFAFFLISFLWNPTLIVLHRRTKKLIIPEDRVLDQKLLFRHVRNNWTDVLRKDENVVFGSGVATAASSGFVSFGFFAACVLLLLLGDGLAPSFVFFVVIVFVQLELFAQNDYGSRDVVCLWALLGGHSFFSFGHQATFNTIPWEAAFIGVPGNFQFQWLQALLILLNLSAGQVLLALLLPLCEVWKLRPGKLGAFSVHGARPGDTETALLEAAWAPRFSRLGLQYCTCLALKLLGVTAASMLHCRHLMVWKIFAPKFVFEGVSFLSSAVAIVIGNLIALRIYKGVQKSMEGKIIQ